MSKNAVYVFLADIRIQALNAIEKRYNEKIKQYQRQASNLLGLDNLVALAAEKGQELLNVQADLAASIRGFAELDDHEARTLLVRFTPETDQDRILDNVFQYIKDDKLKSLCKEKSAKLSETRAAYREITETVKKIRSEKKMLEYLKSLGFKVEDIPKYEKQENKTKPTKEVLFPCLVTGDLK